MHLDALESLWVATADKLRVADRPHVRKLFEAADTALAERFVSLLATAANAGVRAAESRAAEAKAV